MYLSIKNKNKVLYKHKQEYRAFRAARVHDGVHDVPFLENGRPGSVLLLL